MADPPSSPADMPPTALASHIPLAHLAQIPTLFPAPIANLVTALATSARVSLRVVAFFIEAILESCQYSTRLSLGYTRRILITAISSARRMYLMSNAALGGDMIGMMGFGEEKAGPSTDAFLQILDKYTNLGIYVIHHTFTLAELFTMSGFYLTANAIHSAHFAAQESVSLFDSLFGSNESSRALSSIITLVRRELLEDERFEAGNKGKVASLTALTKALTAFACLQTATWKKTSERLKMRVLYDCTVVEEKQESFQSGTTVRSYNNLQNDDGNPRQIELARPVDAHPPLNQQSEDGPGPSTLAARQRLKSQNSMEEVANRLWTHLARPPPTSQSTHPASTDHADLEGLWELEDLVGESGEEMYDGPPDEEARKKRLKRIRDDMFEITDELSESTIVTQLLERISADGKRSTSPWQMKRRSAPLPDISVETLDSEEPEIRISTTSNTPRRGSRSSSMSMDEENDWVEVDQLLDDEMGGEDAKSIPSAPNGTNSVATMSYRDALDHPQQNAERIQLVLKTITQKLLSRKRTIRRLREDDNVSSTRPVSRGASLTPRPSVRGIEWDEDEGAENDSVNTLTSSSTRSAPPPSIASSSSSYTTPKGKSTRSPRDSASPPSAFGPSKSPSPSQQSGISQALTRARSAFKPRSKSRHTPSSSRPPSPRHSKNPVPSKSRPATPTPALLTKTPPPSPHSPTQAYQVPPNTQRGPERLRRPSVSHQSVHTSQSRLHAASAQLLPERGDASSENLFPHEGLVRNIHRFMRYSSAAYGQNFLRILGLGNSDFNFPSTGKHHANSWAFAQHTNIPIDSLLLSSYTESSATFVQQKAPPLVHYIAVEHKLQAIVLTCRGTLGLSDVLVDLTCDYQNISVEGADPEKTYYVHSGMYYSALQLTAKQSTVHQTLVDALTKYPTYGLVIAGHSLGGGVAALLSIACSTPSHVFVKQNAERSRPIVHPRISTPFVTSVASGLPAGRPIHCYAYGPPAVTSIDLAEYCSGLITSVVQNSDIVPTLSLGVLRDLKNVAVTLFEEGNVAEEIVGRVVGIYQRKMHLETPLIGQDAPSDEEMLSDWMISLIKTMRADMDNEKLYPPGMVYIMVCLQQSKGVRGGSHTNTRQEYFDVFVTADPGTTTPSGKNVSHKQAHRVCDSVQERFREPLFTKTMLNDHLPSHYERSTQLLFDGLGQEKM
ncbi:hypothetical protein P7C73_g601, partial [Tremellales sp. Uapishka_1]